MKPIDISNFMGNLVPNTDSYGVPTGIKEFDQLNGGLLPGCLYTIAGRPSTGKSSLMSTMIINQAASGKTILVANLETTNRNFISRLMSILSGIEKRKIESGFLSSKECVEIDNISKQLAGEKIYISDMEETDVEALIKMSKDCSANMGLTGASNIDIIYVDYLQLLSTKDLPYNSYTRNDELTYILKKLKQLARTLNIPIVILSQLNRNANQRNSYRSLRPQLTDLRESGSIEDISDMVLFLHRPELDYERGIDMEGKDIRGLVDIIIAKNRMGSTNDLEMHFDQQTGKFECCNVGFSNNISKSFLNDSNEPFPF